MSFVALGRLMSRKKNWYMFEESQCRLLCYSSADDAKTKECQYHIDISSAAISLNLVEQNQFVIMYVSSLISK